MVRTGSGFLVLMMPLLRVRLLDNLINLMDRKAIDCEGAVWLGRICVRVVGTSGFIADDQTTVRRVLRKSVERMEDVWKSSGWCRQPGADTVGFCLSECCRTIWDKHSGDAAANFKHSMLYSLIVLRFLI